MEKNKSVSSQAKKFSLCIKSELNNLTSEQNSEIRLGIKIADEKAKKEFMRRKAQAPLSTEERILLINK